MKIKPLIFVFCLLAGAGAVYAESLDIDGGFRRLKADGMPLEWLVQRQNDPRHGSFSLQQDKKGKIIRIVASDELEACLYTEPAFPVRDGETIEVSARVRSRSGARLMIYFYDVETHWITSRTLADAPGTETFQTIQGQLNIAPAYPRDGAAEEKKATTIRIALVVPPGGEASFRDITAERSKK